MAKRKRRPRPENQELTKGQRRIIDTMLKRIPGARLESVSRFHPSGWMKSADGFRTIVRVSIRIKKRSPHLAKVWDRKLRARKTNPATVSEFDLLDIFGDLSIRPGGLSVEFKER